MDPGVPARRQSQDHLVIDEDSRRRPSPLIAVDHIRRSRQLYLEPALETISSTSASSRLLRLQVGITSQRDAITRIGRILLGSTTVDMDLRRDVCVCVVCAH